VKSGQYVVVPAGTVHQYGCDEEAPWSIYWLHFKGTAAGDYAAQLTKNKTRFVDSVNFSEERTRLFDLIYTTLENGYSADNLGYINMCLWYFLSSFCYDVFFHGPTRKAEKDAIDNSIEFMQRNIERTLSVRELAVEAHISPSHYAALFKKKTGYPPLAYFNHIKVQKACQYLHFSNLQIKEIAYRVGICDPYYFSRFFSNMMGLSPLEYRNLKH
jgi:AraC-like DNA-binding protein